MEQFQQSISLPKPPYQIELGFFAGPLDLLLHLVRNREVPVSEVDMSQICEQYLEIVLQAKHLDLELASEYLVVAATLLSIKSELLLPAQSTADIGTFDDGSAVYEELRQRLIEYEKFKARAKELHRSPQLGLDTFTRVDRTLYRPAPDLIIENEDGQSLAEMFVSLLKRIGETVQSFRVRLESISVVDYMMRMLGSFQGATTDKPKSLLGFAGELLTEKLRSRGGSPGQAPTAADARVVIIGSMIAVLELVKRGVVRVSQIGETVSGIDISLSVAGAGGVSEGSNVVAFPINDLDEWEQMAAEEDLDEKEVANSA